MSDNIFYKDDGGRQAVDCITSRYVKTPQNVEMRINYTGLGEND